MQRLIAAGAKAPIGIVCALLALTLAACGGGGGAIPAPPIPQQWKQITNPDGAGFPPLLDVCGSSLVALGSFPINHPAAQSSIDHGATWQNSPLAGGMRELGDSGYYWRAKSTNVLATPATDEETQDCGVTWIAISQTLETCLGAVSPRDLWRAGGANRTLYAQGYTPATNQYSLCASLDDGQTWSQGPPLPANALVVAVRGGHWFANAILGNPAPGVNSPNLLLRSDNDGQTWQTTGLYSARSNGLSLIGTTAHGAVMGVIATNQVSGAGGQSIEVLWQWDDVRATWSASPPFPAAINQSMGIDALAANPAVPGQLFIAPFTGGIFESQDGGNSWADASNGFGGLPLIGQLVFDPALANRLYAMTLPFWALDVSP